MGLLTTITVHNDEYHEIKRNPQAFVDQVLAAMDGSIERNRGHFDMFAQRPIHTNDKALYFATGGGNVVDLCRAMPDWARKSAIEYLKFRLKILKGDEAKSKQKEQ
jgi:hypothetical protein